MDFKAALLSFIHCYIASVTGLTSFYYDVRQRRIKRYRWLKIYTILHNLLVLFLTPIYLIYGLFYLEIWTKNILIKYSMAVSVLIATSLITSTLLCRPKRERQMVRIILELNRLEQEYFERWFSQTAAYATVRHLDRIFYAKVLVTIYLTLLEYYNGFTSINAKPDLIWIMCCIYSIAMGNIANWIITYYFIGLWHICTHLYITNMRLRHLVKQYEKFGCTYTFSADLLQVLLVYKKLSLLVGALNTTFKYQSIFLLPLDFINNILTGSYALLFALSKYNLKGIWVSIHAGTYYVGILLDMFIFHSLCEYILEECLETSFQIRTLMVMPIYDSCLERICEETILRFASDRMRLSVLGVYEMGLRLWFSTMSNILLYTVLLLQSDYINMDHFLVPDIFF